MLSSSTVSQLPPCRLCIVSSFMLDKRWFQSLSSRFAYGSLKKSVKLVTTNAERKREKLLPLTLPSELNFFQKLNVTVLYWCTGRLVDTQSPGALNFMQTFKLINAAVSLDVVSDYLCKVIDTFQWILNMHIHAYVYLMTVSTKYHTQGWWSLSYTLIS